ncbi:Ig-like domain-containing protein, partial [Neisseria montereyensis]
MNNYTLHILHNGQQETILLKEGETIVLQAQPDTFYQLLDENGQLIEQPTMEWVGDDLQIYSDGLQEGMPDLVLKDYRHQYPIQNSGYLHDMQSTLATAADEASLQQLSMPVAEEVGITTWSSAAPLWGAAAAVAVAGVAAASHGGGGSSSDIGQQQNDAAEQPNEEPKQETNKTEQPAEETQQTEEIKPPVADPIHIGIAVNPVAEDGVINRQESNGMVTFSGTVQTEGEITEKSISLVIGDKTYPAEVKDNSWSANIDGIALAGVQGEQNITVVVEVTDASGRVHSESTVYQYTVDTEIATPSITVNPITADNVINAQESQSQVAVSGTVTNAQTGDAVTLTVGGNTYNTTVQNGGFSADVPGSVLANQNEIGVNVQTADSAGNQTQATAKHTYQVDTDIAIPSITVNPITADNVINAQESQGTVTVSGTVANAQTGDAVTLTVGGNTYNTTVQNGGFSANIDGSVLAAQNEIGVSVQTADSAGNQTQATAQHAYQVDTDIATPSITVNPITADNVINAQESQSQVAVSGTVANAQTGDAVTLTVGDKTYNTTVQNGGFSANIEGSVLAAQNAIGVSVQTADGAGNQTQATAKHAYQVDTDIATPSITVNPITADNVINAQESQSQVAVSGTVANAQTGDAVTLTVGNNTYNTTVQNGEFSANIDGSVLAAQSEIGVSVQTADGAGNQTQATAKHAYQVDTDIATPSITVNPITAD